MEVVSDQVRSCSCLARSGFPLAPQPRFWKFAEVREYPKCRSLTRGNVRRDASTCVAVADAETASGKRIGSDAHEFAVVSKNSNGDGSVYFEPGRTEKDGRVRTGADFVNCSMSCSGRRSATIRSS